VAHAYLQIDVLESLPSSVPIVLPSTTLAETRHRSLPLYNRLQSLLADEDRKVWIFWNEERRETATKVERYRTGAEQAVTARIDDGDDVASDTEMAGVELSGGTVTRETINDRNDRGAFLIVMRGLDEVGLISRFLLGSHSFDSGVLPDTPKFYFPSSFDFHSSFLGSVDR
jgi:hypothetical protein